MFPTPYPRTGWLVTASRPICGATAMRPKKLPVSPSPNLVRTDPSENSKVTNMTKKTVDSATPASASRLGVLGHRIQIPRAIRLGAIAKPMATISPSRTQDDHCPRRGSRRKTATIMLMYESAR